MIASSYYTVVESLKKSSVVAHTSTMTSMKPEPEISRIVSVVDAEQPFNNHSTDLILHTSDNVNFHVWKCILVEVSPVFADMFVLGGRQSRVNSSSDADNQVVGADPNAPPCIELPESSAVLRHLLLTFYPPPNFTFTSLDDLKPVIAAAHKYQMDSVVNVLIQVLIRGFAPAEPLRVFCIATRYRLPLAQEASARSFLTLSVTAAAEACVDDLEDIDAKVYHRLLACHRKCVADLTETLKTLSWLQDDAWIFTNNVHCGCHYEQTPYMLRGPDGLGVQRNIKRWFLTHYQRVVAILREKPSHEALEDPVLCDEAFKDAAPCSTCRGLVHDHMRTFMKSLRNHVDERVSQVSRVNLMIHNQLIAINWACRSL